MHLSPSTRKILSALDAMSGHTLARRDDLGTLIELAAPDRQSILDDLSFLAKFLTKTYGIMNRIGRDGEGYDRLSQEFGVNLGKATELTRALVGKAPADVRDRFEGTYLAMTQGAMKSFLALLHDLGWYKNLQIDKGRQ